MNFIYLARVFWARRLIVALAVVSALIGGESMILTTPRLFEARSRVELDIGRPDPVTGFVVTGKNVDAFMMSQMQEIRDFQVTHRVAQELGWLDSSDLQQQYASLPAGTAQDFDHWIAQRVGANAYVVPVEDSNLLEIRYRGTSAEFSRLLSAAIRNAYIDASAEQTREIAQASLPVLNQNLEVSRGKIAALEDRKGAMEKQFGLVLQDNGLDMDSQRLGAMARSATTPVFARPPSSRISTAAHQLQALDAELGSPAVQSLGPNNPQLIGLKSRRAALAAQVAQQNTAGEEASQFVQANQRLASGQLSEQTNKVIGDSEKRTQLRLLQDEINAERARYAKTSQRIVDGQRMSTAGGGPVTPVGPTDGPDKPVYPNPPLILVGSAAVGLLGGLLLAFLAEMFSRRVRTENDLQSVGGSSIVVVPKIRRPRRRWFGRAATA